MEMLCSFFASSRELQPVKSYYAHLIQNPSSLSPIGLLELGLASGHGSLHLLPSVTGSRLYNDRVFTNLINRVGQFREIYASYLGSFLLATFSGAVDCSLAILCFTSSIHLQANQREIRELFSTFGELKTVRLPKKMTGTGAHRGFGFVDFVTKQDAKKAFNVLCHSTHLYGRRLVLE
ncbi:hypothetical protein STEG23_026163 [Scotinomys teguina]